MSRALVVLASGGDAEAFAQLARDAADVLYAVAYRVLRDHARAEDAVQSTLVSAWRTIPSLRDPDRFEAWLRRILVHACYAEGRRASRDRRSRADDRAPEPAGLDTTGVVADRDQLERAFRRLPTDQRVAFVLHHELGLTQAELAEELRIPIGTVKSRIHAATATLRAAIDADLRPGLTTRERLA